MMSQIADRRLRLQHFSCGDIGDAEMEQPFSAKSVHDTLCRYMRNRPDIGVRKAVLDAALEARNPFEPKAARAPQRGFVLFALLATLLLACFLYFNLR